MKAFRMLIVAACLHSGLFAGGTVAAESGFPVANRGAPRIDQRESPVDLSFLNASERPAGRRGFLKASGERLAFADGTEARFWGTNIAAYALFSTSPSEVKQQARRLSRLGFNLVRLHHMDSDWVAPNIFEDPVQGRPTRLNAAALERIDWWIKCLKDEGIYVWLDLHDGRQLNKADGIEQLDELRRGKDGADLRGYNYVNPSIRRAMQETSIGLLTRVNKYTGVRYADEPAIAVVLITNENDVTHHFGNSLLGDKGVPWHSAAYMREAGAFARKWDLPEQKVWRSWEHGPSKLFLNDLEHRFNSEMVSVLRSVGVRVPIVTTSTWGNPISSLPALTMGDMIDAHAAGGPGELRKNPLEAASLVHWLAAARVSGKPLSISEWGVEDKGQLSSDRQDIPLFVAGWGSRQGWNAILHFAYSQESFGWEGKASIYHAYNDPAMLSTMPAAALMYRQGHLPADPESFALAPTADVLVGREISAGNSVGLRTAAESGRLSILLPVVRELPWLVPSTKPSGSTLVTDPARALIQRNASQFRTASGRTLHDWANGVYLIDTPATQAVMGDIGRKEYQLADITVRVTTPNATVAVQSLEGAPIHDSRRLLISLGAKSTLAAGGKLPFESEPVTGVLAIRAPAGLILYAHDATGKESRIPAQRVGDRYVIDLAPQLGTYWLSMSPPMEKSQ